MHFAETFDFVRIQRRTSAAGAISIFFLVSLSVTWVGSKYQFLSRVSGRISSDVCVIDRPSKSDCHYVNYVGRGLRAGR